MNIWYDVSSITLHQVETSLSHIVNLHCYKILFNKDFQMLSEAMLIPDAMFY